MIVMKDEIKKQVQESIDTKQLLSDSEYVDEIEKITKEIIKAYKKNKKVIWFGNGGSAADAQHLSCELVSKFLIERDAIPSIALTTNTSILTAVGNDYDFLKIFERQIEALAEKGDILVGITTSGTSKNIIKGFNKGKKIGTVNVAFTGKNISKIKKYADYIIDIPSYHTPRIQEAHILVGHIICDIIEKTLFGE